MSRDSRDEIIPNQRPKEENKKMLHIGGKGIATVAVLAMLLTSMGVVAATTDDSANPRNWRPSTENAAAFFENKLQLVNDKLAAVQAKLAAASENQPGIRAVQRQVELAIEFRDNAVQADNSDNDNFAIELLRVAWVHLRNADRILDHGASLLERLQQRNLWRQQWRNMMQEYKDNLVDLRGNCRENRQQLMEQWRIQRQEMRNEWHAGED